MPYKVGKSVGTSREGSITIDSVHRSYSYFLSRLLPRKE